MSQRNVTKIGVLVAMLAISSGLAVAQPHGAPPKSGPDRTQLASAKPHILAGDTAYKVGKFADALAAYTRAYEIYAAPGLLFNIGQCHRNLRQYDKAIFSFESYLRATPDAGNRALVEDLITESRTLLDKQNAEATRAREAAQTEEQRKALEVRRAADDAARARALAESKTIAEARVAAAEADRRKSDRFYRKWWFWGLVGSAAVAAGGTIYYFSGETTYIDPMGSVGGLDRR